MKTRTLAHLLMATSLVAVPSVASAQSWAADLRDSIRSMTRDMSRHGWSDQQSGPETTEKFARTIKVGANAVFDLRNISGDIVITVGKSGEIVVDALKRVRVRDAAEAKSQLAEVRIDVVERAPRVEIRTVYPERGNSRVSVSFNVAVPSDCEVALKSISGDIKLTGVKGDVRLESVSGDITATDVPKLSLAKSVSGDVEVTGVASDATVNLASISGDVVVRGLKAKAVEASSISGQIMLTDAVLDRVTAKSISGDIEYKGSLAKSGRYELKAHSGDIRLVLPAGSGFELDATSFSGDIQTDFPVTTHGIKSDKPMRHTLTGTAGDGSAYLGLNSFSGDITITKR